METAEQQTGPSNRKALPSTSTQTESTQAPDPDVQADTLSSSSDSDLPLGLPTKGVRSFIYICVPYA